MARRTLARGICSVWLAALTLAACGSTPAPTGSPAAVVAAAQSPAATPTYLAPDPASPSPSPSTEPTTPVDPTIADLTGVKTDPALAHRLPLAVLIDDNQVARPQSGFNGASIVYQAPADGGETRYMMVFQEGTRRRSAPFAAPGSTSSSGPARSAPGSLTTAAIDAAAPTSRRTTISGSPTSRPSGRAATPITASRAGPRPTTATRRRRRSARWS